MLTRAQAKRKTPFDLFGFDEDFFSQSSKEFESAKGKGKEGSGYSVSVRYDDKGEPVVNVQTYGEVDANELRKDLLKRYPNAKIEGLEKKPLIRVVGEDEKAEPEKKSLEKEKKKKKSTSIRIVE